MLQLNFAIPKEDMFVNHTYLSGTTNSLREHFFEVKEYALSNTKLNPDDYVLDIGGNDGTFLEHFVKIGQPVLNVDSGLLQASKCKDKGIPVLTIFSMKSLQIK